MIAQTPPIVQFRCPFLHPGVDCSVMIYNISAPAAAWPITRQQEKIE